jgi:hypothetical protein
MAELTAMTARELCKYHHIWENTLTSQTSSKLLHGGLRYLANFEFRI